MDTTDSTAPAPLTLHTHLSTRDAVLLLAELVNELPWVELTDAELGQVIATADVGAEAARRELDERVPHASDIARFRAYPFPHTSLLTSPWAG